MAQGRLGAGDLVQSQNLNPNPGGRRVEEEGKKRGEGDRMGRSAQGQQPEASGSSLIHTRTTVHSSPGLCILAIGVVLMARCGSFLF